MANLSAEQTTRLARMAGEGHKAVGQRMLDDATLDLIAGDVAMLKDSNGLLPGESTTILGVVTNYINTVDIYRAAAEAWRAKAGMVADGYDFKAEGASFTRSQMYDHYMEQAGRYAGMASSLSSQVNRPATEDVDTDAFEEWLNN